MGNMKNNLLIGGGLLLIAAALCLTIYNQMKGQWAAQASEQALQKLEASVSSTAPASRTEEVPDPPRPAYLSDPDVEMPTREVDGNLYIGILEIPALELKLPIISEWSDARLDVAPCRYTGSAYQNNMIIAGHNYKQFFGSLSELANGDEVIFTDIEGNRFQYTVSLVEQLPGTAIEEMEAGDWDLTLFTCNFSGNARVTARCRLAA